MGGGGGRQWVACLTADPGVSINFKSLFTYIIFMEIDQEIISTDILSLPLKNGICQLLAKIFALQRRGLRLPRKSVSRLSDQLD